VATSVSKRTLTDKEPSEQQTQHPVFFNLLILTYILIVHGSMIHDVLSNKHSAEYNIVG